jgi:hypothetical protein
MQILKWPNYTILNGLVFYETILVLVNNTVGTLKQGYPLLQYEGAAPV